MDIDRPGKDGDELRKAGTDQVLIGSRRRGTLIRECAESGRKPRLADLLHCVDTRELDLILVGGFKREPIPKIDLCRLALDHPPDPCRGPPRHSRRE